ncbi:MAG TPA: hypothetical protein VK528_03830 [Flavobacterium sp.]|nr:hypothetical protein [Flavobacterium sp.]
MKKKILFLLAVIIISGAFFGYKFLYHDHRDVSTEDASFTISVKALQDQFVSNDSLANAKYADKTIEIYGKVTAIDLASNAITIDEKLSAVMKEKPKAIKAGDAIKVKGRFVGYDDLLEELKMDQVSILK